jgi:hypothetical protein
MYVTTHHALDAISNEEVAEEIRNRAEITDAMYRFGLGQDLLNRSLFLSAFTPNAELDFRPAAQKIGIEPVLLQGRDLIVDTILGLFANRVATTHTVSNTRIAVEGERARFTAIVEAQHLLTRDRQLHALLKNLYYAELVQDSTRWLIDRLVIDNVWFTGKPKAIFSV